ncbi:DNA N-6-adenine-methyltransferase [Phenylobacterium ferrooxidans]|uniref:Phage N-6-adenine-methyltransferase n=1 Tax=Phenylobacterium ferrooxidans TaxID=2982689 RepID=A0ABW6CMX5_9CAUL
MSVAAHRFDNEKRRRPDSHARQAMLTPGYVLEPIREHLGGIGLDPCTEPDNPTRADTFYCLPQDGCALPWDAQTVFCNPPYGEAKDRWAARCITEGEHRKVLLLIPAHTENRTLQRCLSACTSAMFIKARLRFGVLRDNGRQEAASHGSVLLGFGVNLTGIAVPGVVMVRAI